MFCCDTGGASSLEFEELAVFVGQLGALGIDARIDVRAVPAGLHRTTQFDIAPYLFDGTLGSGDRLVLVSANRLTEEKLVNLRRLDKRSGTPCLAIGAFAGRQAVISVKAKLSYVFGEDPGVLDLSGGAAHGADVRSGCPVFGVPKRTVGDSVPRLLLVSPDLADASQGRALVALARTRKFRTAVLTDAKTKRKWTTDHGTEIPIYDFGEVMPASLADRADICVTFASPQSSYRLQSLVADLAVSGAALVDGTVGLLASRDADAFIAGPPDIAGLAGFLSSEIVPNLGQITTHVQRSKLAKASAADGLLQFLGAEPRRAVTARPAPRARTRVVFMPTNGIGLGHAQRCSLIASEIDRSRFEPDFAAFPSCMGMIKSYGFDVMPLVGRSSHHAQSHENDLPNYLRLRAFTSGAGALVFDGVYVFDSVFRAIHECGLRGVWIRRGLWQAGQDNAIALDREKAFDRVIVPSEAFDELNAAYSHGDHVRTVGPIVQKLGLDPAARQAFRDRIAARFDSRFDRLVVSLLGSGVAADRTAQIQALCGMMARRSDVLHLVVVWPTAVLHPAWFTWSNSRIVKSHHAGVLAAAADLCISASGYNSFHEILYNGITAIFVPQMEARMDDQKARAAAARKRDLAGMVEARHLMALDREVLRFLDGGAADAVRRSIAALDLPAPGNAEAAHLIEEATDGPAAVERGSGTGERARRR